MAEITGIYILIKPLNQHNKISAYPCIKGLTPEIYYRMRVAIQYIDSFIQQLKARFLSHKNIFKNNLKIS